MERGASWRQSLALVAAVVLLDASLTFQNVWPTPAVTWTGRVSIELAVCVLGLVVLSRLFGPPSRLAIRALTALWTVLVVSHYAEVTAPALYGRDVNLYWDARLLSAVASMLASAASRWRVLTAAAVALLVFYALYRILRWAMSRIGQAMSRPDEYRVLALVALLAVALFAVQRVFPAVPAVPRFSTPVTDTYVHQIRLVRDARAASAGAQVVAASPPMQSDLSLVKGADVLLLFIESYGAVTFDRPEFARALASDRADLDAAIRDTHRQVVSAFVESPTFGGSSWLAHITLLTGVPVRDPDTNALLMTQQRDTLVTAFGRHGYRTVAVMPGLWQRWPEGAFYHFDEIDGGERLDYHGPQFGWWDIPDQFTIARMDERELGPKPRQPAFVFFPTISTHIPFTPTPPYQPDWSRMLTAQPYDDATVLRAFGEQPDWLDLGPSYVQAMSYEYKALAGYLRRRADEDFVLVLLGDHQPAAAVTGEGAPWDVPVHVIASRRAVLDRMIARGFREGLTPARPRFGPMNTLTPALLDAMGDREPAAASTP